MSAGSSVAQDTLVTGSGGLPKVVLAASDGARIEAYLHGAHVTSWHPAGAADDRLFLSPLARFASGTSIRGGVPVCFPQFADQGPLPMHGFARDIAWNLVVAGRDDDGAAHARFRLTDSPDTRALWPHSFACELSVTARGPTLAIELAVTNTGPDAFAFTTALHSYLRVRDVRQVRLHGLQGTRYRDKIAKQDDLAEDAPDLVVDRPIDRVYRSVPARLAVREPDRSLLVQADGTTDTVVWNPGPPDGAGPADLPPDAYLSMLCVEAAVASKAIVLLSAETWRVEQTLSAMADAKDDP